MEVLLGYKRYNYERSYTSYDYYFIRRISCKISARFELDLYENHPFIHFKFADSIKAHSSIPTLLYSLWKKKLMLKVSQKSEVLNLRYINACQYCKYYLKYWSKGINGPLDPWGGQNFQCFIKWDGLTGRGGVRWRAQINFLSKIIILNPSVDPPASSKTISLYKTLKILTPWEV